MTTTAVPAGPTRAPSSVASRPRRPLPRAVYRFRLATVALALVALAFLQDPGRVAADTKLDLTQDPWGFLGRAVHLWDPQGFFGQLQNQAYGYLLPMGPFFGIGTGIGLPAWVVQRLWWSVLLVAGFLGVVRLARLLGLERALPRVLAGLTYVLSARMLTTLGPISAEALPMALAPWMLVPLVAGSRGGSPRRWAALSAVAVALMGGVNAVATVAVLPLGAWWLLTRERGPRRRRLMAWWAVGVGLATAWWVLPLLLLGRYSPPFLDWIESSSVTTSVTSPEAILRGTSHWVAYLADAGGPVWQAGWTLVTSPAAVLATGVVAAVGLAGLALPRVAERRFLVLVLLTGVVLLSLGHTGAVQGLGAESLRALLDGVLAPLRNVHKAQPLVSLPLALGLGWAVTALLARVERRRTVTGMRFGMVATGPTLIALGLVVVAVAGAAAPAWEGALTRGRSFVDVPAYWRETADWLAAKGAAGRALVVPGASFGTYLWGRPQDEPLQPLANSPWAVRDAVPLSSAGNIRFLDAVEERLADGRGGAGLAEALRRAGVTHLVVRNDLDPARSSAPRQVVLHQALARSPGLTRVAFFGPVLAPFTTDDLVFDGGLAQAYPAVEVYAVAVPGAPDEARVALRDAATVMRFSGGTESLVPLADAGLLDPDRAAVWAGDPVPEGSAVLDVQTDGARRTELNVGLVRDNRSNTLTADDGYRLARRVHDYLLSPSMPLAEASVVGAREVVASSSGSQADALRARSASSQPWSALDGDPDTAWVSGDATPGVGQWWEVRLDRPVTASTVSVRVVQGLAVGPAPRAVRVSTDRGERDVVLRAGGAAETLALPGGEGPVSWLRLTLLRVDGDGPGDGFGLREVALPGVQVARPVTAVAPGSAASAWVLTAREGEVSGCVELPERMACASGLARTGEDRAGIDRVIEVAAPTRVDVALSVVPRPGIALDRLVVGFPRSIRASADSRLVSEPAVRPQAAVDRDLSTGWVASPLSSRPTLTLRLPERRVVSGVRLRVAPGLAASRPLEVSVDAGAGATTVFLDERGVARIPATTTRTVKLTFGVVSPVRTIDPLSATTSPLPVGVSEVEVLGADDLRRGLALAAGTGLPCGYGPSVLIDGRRVATTAVTSSVGALVAGRRATATACAPASVLLPAGRHRVTVPATAEFLVTGLTLRSPSTPPVAVRPSVPTVVAWEPTSRVVAVPPSDTVRTLELEENANAGWTASLDGVTLSPLRVDGWRQAFVLPAGSSGLVRLTYEPDAVLRAALLIGAVALGALLLVVLLPARRRPPGPVGPAGGGILVGAVVVAALVLVAGPAGLLVGGAAAAVVLLAARRGRDLAAALIGALLLAAALAAAWVPWPASSELTGWRAALPSLLVVAALGAIGARAAAAEPRAPSS